MDGGTIQQIAISYGDLKWIGGAFVACCCLVSSSVWWLAHQFRLLRDELAAVNLAMATTQANAAGDAKHNDTRFEQHSGRLIQLDARVHELEQWRLHHIEDHP